MSMLALGEARAPSPFAWLATAYAEMHRRQPLFGGMAVVMAALVPPTLAAALLEARTVYDIGAWSKPLKFEVSLAMFFATLAWFWGYLPEEKARSRFLNAWAVVTVAGVAFEMAYMIIQSGRGVGSHFNIATLVEAVLFPLMGLAALLFTAMPAILGVAIARHASSSLAPAFRLSVVLGLILTFVLGAGAGIVISVNGGHWVAAPHTDAGGLPIFGWTRAGGDLRVAHFFGIHAMQLLPLAGWLIARRRPGATGLVWAAAAGLAGIAIYTGAEALAGQPFLGFIG